MSDRSTKDKEMAKHLKDRNAKHPGSVPNSIVPGWRGNGHDLRKMSRGMTVEAVSNSRWAMGMMGGILAYRLGYKCKELEEAGLV